MPDSGHRPLTRLMRAAAIGHTSVVKRLIEEEGEDVNARGPREATPLLFAVGGGHLEVVKELVEHGADIEAQEASGWTARRLAVEDGYNQIAEYLEEQANRVNERTHHVG